MTYKWLRLAPKMQIDENLTWRTEDLASGNKLFIGCSKSP